MKKLLILLFAASLTLASCTDNPPGVNKAFLKYGHKGGITSVTVPGFVIRLAASFADIEDEEKELLRSIDKVKVLAVDDHYLNEEIDLHGEFYNSINRDGEFEELLAVRDASENVTIFGKMDDRDIIREMVILVGGDDNALVYIKGRLDPRLINEQIDCRGPDDFLSFDF